MKLKCKSCWELKHDTAFLFKEKKFLFWRYIELDTSKCLDCLYPNRWDGVKREFKEYFNW